MRRELRAHGIERLTVVCSGELPLRPSPPEEKGAPSRAVPGSVSFVPPVAGMMAASVVVRALAGVVLSN
jgi:tRNA A37 threonylcarbamoyladenosine dehydratase